VPVDVPDREIWVTPANSEILLQAPIAPIHARGAEAEGEECEA
jgi:hypothetical protein